MDSDHSFAPILGFGEVSASRSRDWPCDEHCCGGPQNFHHYLNSKIHSQNMRALIPARAAGEVDGTSVTSQACFILSDVLFEDVGNDVYHSPKELDEEVAKLHIPALNLELTVFTQDSAG